MRDPLRVRVDRDLTLLLEAHGDLFAATVAECPRVRVRASTLELMVRGAREGVAKVTGK